MVSAVIRIPMRRAGGIDRLEYFVAPSDVFFFFAGSAARRGLVNVTNYDPLYFKPSRVYARTAKEVYVLSVRSLAELTEILDPYQFRHTHQSILANMARASFLDLTGKAKLLGFAFGNGSREVIPISRRFLPGVRPRKRRPPRPKSGP